LLARTELVVIVEASDVAVRRQLLVRAERAPDEAVVRGRARVRRQAAADQRRGGEEPAAAHVDVFRGYLRGPNSGSVSNEHSLSPRCMTPPHGFIPGDGEGAGSSFEEFQLRVTHPDELCRTIREWTVRAKDGRRRPPWP